jgi:hypothetical protein
MARVSSLWVGKPLSLAHKVALSSFVYYGHEIKLYVYDMSLDVPDGVIRVDANDIVPESDIFIHYGKLAPFADYFRYKMIAKTGEMWVDADTICLSEYFFEDKEYVFIEEMPNFYAQGILKMPPESAMCRILDGAASKLRLRNQEKLEGEFIGKTWIFLGPDLLTKIVTRLSLQQFAQPALFVNGLDLSVSAEDPYKLLWNPKNLNEMTKRLESSVSLTFFNSSLEWRGLSEHLNDFPEGSMMKEFYNKFLNSSQVKHSNVRNT